MFFINKVLLSKDLLKSSLSFQNTQNYLMIHDIALAKFEISYLTCANKSIINM